MSDILSQIEKLKKEKNAIILAHYYQNADIQDLADFVGDSYFLSEKARDSNADYIIYCGVKFMAESAKILSPNKRVFFPAYANAECCMEYMATPTKVQSLKDEYPEAKVVCYINSSSEVKALSDACCTSSSAEKIVNKIDAKQIIFVPDKNLGSYIQEKTDKEIILFDGCCNVHDKVTPKHIKEYKDKYQNIEVVAHPECKKEVRDLSDYVGSTSGILNYVKTSHKKEFLIVTEKGIAHELYKQNPDKKFYFINMICNSMKKIFPETILEALQEEKYEIFVDKDIIKNAKKSLDNMLLLSRGE
ncbi:quinolinate synthetase [Hypnocyclicus thermotrophus]|uniref:Quinolinate synthase n=1 Tax=Hypnocyclicus thermotrophus TaxID=1627895 RepID=A0AA46I513_9FUSO|nr:quinolinate synthase NadA [Hypnocyclicus thermotrophus]TDT68115.1 quinolinate synthetase [Hypnocyclicus thermotrophus]